VVVEVPAEVIQLPDNGSAFEEEEAKEEQN